MNVSRHRVSTLICCDEEGLERQQTSIMSHISAHLFYMAGLLFKQLTVMLQWGLSIFFKLSDVNGYHIAVCATISSPIQSCYFLICVQLLLSYENKELLHYRGLLMWVGSVCQFVTQYAIDNMWSTECQYYGRLHTLFFNRSSSCLSLILSVSGSC